jgi:hypothetical protein
MDEEDYSRYFFDAASEFDAPSYSEAAPTARSLTAPSDQSYAAPFDISAYQSPEIDQYMTQFSGGDPEGARTYADLQQMMQDGQTAGQGVVPSFVGNDQSFGFLPPQELNQAEKAAIAREEASPGGTAMNRVDKNALTSGISAAYKALQQANKKAGPDQMSKKDALSMLMPLLLAMIAKNQGGSSGRSPAQEATQPKIPSLTATREMTPYAAPGEKGYTRPGAGGKKYFSDIQYKADGGEIQSQPFSPGPTTYKNPYSPPDPVIAIQTTYKAAGGGIGDLGGYSDGGRLLKGPGDGVSDSIPAKIGQSRPARLSDGEFVIPARIVSELGNGSTEAGAKKLYAMMDRVKKARNHKNIAANTKADKHLPA